MRLFKNISIYFLLASVLFQTFATVGIIVQFEANRKYYAEVLCINKNRPELACEGKCVLMQRLQNEFEKQQDTEKRTLQNLLDREITLYCSMLKMPDLHIQNPIIPKNIQPHFYYTNFYTRLSVSDIFHPPTLLS
jgi:hypothetical protein